MVREYMARKDLGDVDVRFCFTEGDWVLMR